MLQLFCVKQTLIHYLLGRSVVYDYDVHAVARIINESVAPVAAIIIND